MKKNTSARRKMASKGKVAARKISTGKAALGRSKAASIKAKERLAIQTGANATAPIVYRTLRERIDAVDTNVGETETLSEFLESAGW